MPNLENFELHSYQKEAAKNLAGKYFNYHPSQTDVIPLIQSLVSVTGSGKTAILVQTVSNIFEHSTPNFPIIFWLSCNKVVVRQTLRNLKGKYYSLLPPITQIKPFLEINYEDITNPHLPLIYVDTVQKFSVENKETRKIYQLEADKGDKSRWDLLKERMRRDLIIIYDESQNLSDRQLEKTLELSPQLIILSSGTPSYPSKLKPYLEKLEAQKQELITAVSFQKVKERQMVKSKVVLGGYNHPMHEVINEMLGDWQELSKLATEENLSTPKIIYVCKTNLLELEAKKAQQKKRDDPQVPFSQRQAPPILIWNYLVKQRKIDPETIAIYADIDMAEEEKYALDLNFKRNLFGRSGLKENTYEKFIKSDFQHIIFNRSLAEGWDNPMIYLAYIDKTIGSEVAIEQIIGRVLRQPNCQYYKEEKLNKAYFHIRVDEDQVFQKVISDLNDKLVGIDIADIEIRDSAGKLGKTIDLPVKFGKSERKVPLLTWDIETIQRRLQRMVDSIPDYSDRSKYPETCVQNIGQRQWTEYELGIQITQPAIRQESFGLTNMVPARVILRRTIINKNTKVYNLLEWENRKFDALVGWGSKAEQELRQVGEELIATYLKESSLKVNLDDPYQVKGLRVRKKQGREFINALHSQYNGSDLNNLERRVAEVLDGLGMDWCRNPTWYGYSIELIDEEGATEKFYPDFLLWLNEETAICLEVTAEHLEKDKLKRKLVWVKEAKEEVTEQAPKNVKVVILIQYGNPKENEEIYYKVWYRTRRSGEVKSIRVESISEGLTTILGDL
jgi:type III restriction enzyme